MLKKRTDMAFLLLELLLALALLVSLISTIGYWQWRIVQQEVMVKQYLHGMLLAENVLEQILAAQIKAENGDWQSANYAVSVRSDLLTTQQFGAYKWLKVAVSWLDQTGLQRRVLQLESGLYVPK